MQVIRGTSFSRHLLLAALLTLGMTMSLGPTEAIAAPGAPTIVVPTDNGAPYPDSSQPPVMNVTLSPDTVSSFCGYDNEPMIPCLFVGLPFGPTQLLANGSHVARAIAVAADGTYTVTKHNFTIDDQVAPTMTIDSPAEDALLTSTPSFKLTFGDATSRLYARIDGGPDELIQPRTASMDIDHFGQIKNGRHTVTFTLRDGAGNTTIVSRGFTLDDDTPPQITALVPVDGATLKTRRLTVGFDSPEVELLAKCQIDAEPEFDCQANARYDRGFGHAVGSHTFKVTATDVAGNVTTETASFTFADADDGALTIASPANGQTFAAEPLLEFGVPTGGDGSAECSLDGNSWFACQDGAPITGLSGSNTVLHVKTVAQNGDVLVGDTNFTINDSTGPTLDLFVPVANETFTDSSDFLVDYSVSDQFAGGSDDFDVQTPQCSIDSGTEWDCDQPPPTAADLSQGAHQLSIVAEDWTGNKTSQTIDFTINDTIAPAVNIIYPETGDAVASGRPVLTAWTDDPGASFTCQLDSAAAVPCQPRIGWPVGGSSVLSPGSHTITVIASDAAGNSASDSVTINNTDVADPILTITSPAHSAQVSNPSIINWSANEPIVRAECQVDSGPLIDSAVSPTNCIAGTGNVGSFHPATQPEGSHTLTVTVFDAAGNSGSASRDLVYDETAPVITISSPAGPTTESPNATLTFSVTDAVDTSPNCTRASGSALTLVEGPNTIRVNCTDAAGNVGTAAVVVTYAEPTPPPPPPPPAPPAPPTPPAPPVAPPAGPATVRPHLRTIKPRFGRKTTKLPIHVAFRLPAGINPRASEARQACRGSATITLKRGRRAVRVRSGRRMVKRLRVKLRMRGSRCTIKTNLLVTNKSAINKKLTLRVAFAGNSKVRRFTIRVTGGFYRSTRRG